MDEGAGAANHEKAHKFTPVIGMFTFLERGEAVNRALMPTRKLLDPIVAVPANVFLGP
ncbi:MAG: hypothetical protein ACREIC_12720 [Limisphaerales bacterium]